MKENTENNKRNQTYIFISYIKKDSRRAARLAEMLDLNGFRIRSAAVAKNNKRDDYAKKYYDIRDCGYYVPILTRESMLSDQYANEVRAVYDFNKKVVPFVLDGAIISDKFALCTGKETEKIEIDTKHPDESLDKIFRIMPDATEHDKPMVRNVRDVKKRRRLKRFATVLMFIAAVVSIGTFFLLQRESTASKTEDYFHNKYADAVGYSDYEGYDDISRYFPDEDLGEEIMRFSLNKDETGYNCSLSEYSIEKYKEENEGAVIAHIVIPDEYEGLPVVAVTGSFCEEAEDIRTVYIPDTVTEIYADCFTGCPNLEAVRIPDSVTSIGKNCFSNCPKLKELRIPENLESLGSGSFCDDNSLIKLRIPPGLADFAGSFLGLQSLERIDASLDSGYFCSSRGILYNYSGTELLLYPAKKQGKTYKLPKTVENIRPGAFAYTRELRSIKQRSSSEDFELVDGILYTKDMSELIAAPGGLRVSSITVPDGVSHIDEYAFCGLEKMTELSLPESLTQIGDRAFSGSGLISLDMPSTVLSLGSGAFSDCVQLSSVSLSDGLTELPKKVFEGCKAIASVKLPKAVTKIQAKTFAECAQLERITLPSSLEEIGESCFENDAILTDVVFSGTLNTIGEYAFRGCSSLTQLQLPAGITLKSCAFEDCTSIESVEFKGEPARSEDGDAVKTEIDHGVFRNCSSLKILKLPEGVHISNDTFEGCIYIEEIEFSGKPGLISASCFTGCCNVRKVTLPVIDNDDFFSYRYGPWTVCFYEGTNIELFLTDGDSELNVDGIRFLGSYIHAVHIPESVQSIDPEGTYNSEDIFDWLDGDTSNDPLYFRARIGGFDVCGVVTVYAPHPPEYYGYTPSERVVWITE